MDTEPNNNYINEYKEQLATGKLPSAYQSILKYIKGLRNYFELQYPSNYVVGSVYEGHLDISYFPFTPVALKQQKLKIAIVFNHQQFRFEIWLAGQNKQIQKKYWEAFKGSDWNKYHLPENITDGFSIVDDILVENPNFANPNLLTEQIENKAITFINDVAEVLILE